MDYIAPPPLHLGDTIGIMAPSSRIARDDIEASKTFLESKGYKVLVHPQTYLHADAEPATQYAGSVNDKLSALHDLARDAAVKAVIFATGGQRAMTLLDAIDYSLLATFPKIYMGFSDHTVLLNAIAANTGLVTYHGPTFKRTTKNPQIDFNLRFLEGREKSIPLHGATSFKHGNAKGKLFGGNLASLRSLTNTELSMADGGILFLEEIGEELSTIDRDLCALKRRGLLHRLSGLIFGQFTDMKDTGTPFGMGLSDIIAEHTAELDIPILANAPFGHDTDLYALPIGATVTLDANARVLTLA
ncbi:MAG: LD-carboxypeptidase [Micavibrio aeruginosavorus]|uniref:LD-carboxypeptidase n=1 Tax=Micavibrio aeruginosavorus TaxID=349221 RepID=A0A2W5MXH8_9BACT|nr:MAG: LD-carboxypeptidase [Micavibrio aeruginosavorus]